MAHRPKISRDALFLHINVGSIHNISVTWRGHGLPELRPLATRGIAEASFVSQWWINRVLVQPESVRGLGVGGHMLDCLLETIANRGGREVFVAPGGYGNNTQRQLRFYLAHGFKPVEPDLLRWEALT